ncbi:MAG: hypothetical protein BWK72_12215 [Rhodoferax ferrireducens]|uniref:Uncharacterized protein n=1 Tax=Rhodoferax ferrireducens TaxID=192843 RepID=A0A1W9KT98_9BURK|nr:MAG: hypothetical protein BWK72_12215 [Rhodoferax ferrireducens]
MNHIKIYFNVAFLLLTSLLTIPVEAKSIFNNGGLGCGTIVSLRESTQKPLPSELADEYGAPKTSGGVVLQILSNMPGVGVVAAVAGETIASAAISTVSANLQEADRVKQAETATYKDVMAVEFRFDDGEIINIPVYVVSGMRYKVGTRLNAMISPRYGNLALGANGLFASMPEVGDSDYSPACRVDDPETRKAALESIKNLVNESQIVNPSERREANPLPKTSD